jgi:hypothetical protein
MKHVCATATVLLMLGGMSLPQGSAGGSSGGGTSGTGSSSPASPGISVSPGNNAATVPPGTTLPGGSPAPSDSSTVGRGPGINPANPQDMLNRSNPQDLNRPRGRNPSDAGSGTTGGTPQIMVPER